MAWVSVSERLPPEGRRVRVFGSYTNPEYLLPWAWTCNCGWIRRGPHLESREWRGMVGVGWWWEEEMKPYVVEAIHANATRLGKVAAEDARERAQRQLGLFAQMQTLPYRDVRRALEDLPPEQAAGVELFLILLETEAPQ